MAHKIRDTIYSFVGAFMEKHSMSKKIVLSALTAIVALGVAQADAQSTPTKPAKMLKGMEKCFGVAKAGMNDCGTPTNTGCAGSSKVDSDKGAWIYLPKGTCNKIVGGSTKEGK
jgi:uncharacterized membrane protein